MTVHPQISLVRVELIDHSGHAGFGNFLGPVVLGCADRAAESTEGPSQHGHPTHHEKGAHDQDEWEGEALAIGFITRMTLQHLLDLNRFYLFATLHFV